MSELNRYLQRDIGNQVLDITLLKTSPTLLSEALLTLSRLYFLFCFGVYLINTTSLLPRKKGIL